MNKTRPKSFVLYTDFEPALLQMSVSERGMLFTMIYSYVNRGCVDTLIRKIPRRVEMAFVLLRAQLDRDIEKYERICERNAENGMLGGRPKTQKTQSVFEKPKKAYNNTNNKNKNNTYTNNNNMRSFDPEDFFAAALALSYGETENEEKEEKEEEGKKEDEEATR